MQNKTLAQDYLIRCQARLKSIETLFAEKAWADVVRESQEVVELALKALLRAGLIEVPRIHDVGDVLLEQKARFPSVSEEDLNRMARVSRALRRDRELAFYGSEDLTPSEFYKEEDAVEARDSARWVVGRVRAHVPG